MMPGCVTSIHRNTCVCVCVCVRPTTDPVLSPQPTGLQRGTGGREEGDTATDGRDLPQDGDMARGAHHGRLCCETRFLIRQKLETNE